MTDIYLHIVARRPFDRSIQSMCASTVTSLLELYAEAGKVLLPTPKKSHYQFNLRDLSKCVSGIMQVKCM